MLRPGLIENARIALGDVEIRASTAADAVEGLQPQIVVAPDSPEALARTLSWASEMKLGVVVRGHGARLDWGPSPHRFDLLLSTSRLGAVLAHRHGDLTATVQAGATLADVNRALARHRQWLPLDPPDPERTTIGGLVATNDSGPRRHRYGAPRDLIIGIEVARADGELAKGGGIVVKNVAGYDLPRLFTGSFGSLGVIVSATFKLFPLPSTSRTVAIEAAGVEQAASLAAGIAAGQLTPTAVELAGPPFELFVRFESVDAAVQPQTAAVRQFAERAGARAHDVTGVDEAELWTRHEARVWHGEGAVVKVAVLPTELAATTAWMRETLRDGTWDVIGRAGLGVLYVRVNDQAESVGRFVNGLRDRLPTGRGSAVLLRGSSELKKLVDVWGPIGDGAPLMRSVKRQFDPEGVLNPGRGPGGL